MPFIDCLISIGGTWQRWHYVYVNHRLNGSSSHVLTATSRSFLRESQQEIWANAHETRDSISLISAKIHSKCASQPKMAKNSLKNPYFGVQGRSRSSMLVPLESSSAVVVMIGSMSVSICNHSRVRLVDSSRNRTFSSLSICNHSRARLVDSSRNRTFSRGYPNLMRSYGGLLEPYRGSSLITPLKSTVNAEHFLCRLY